MFRWKLWLVLAPVAIFLLASTMSSCGGGGGCFGSFTSSGVFLPGVCAGSTPTPGFALEQIVICPTPVPTVRPTGSATPTPTRGATPTATPTACPSASGTEIFTPTPFPSGTATQVSPTPTATPSSSVAYFIAQGVLTKGKKTTWSDITNAPSTLWTTNNNPPGGPQVLQPPTGDNGNDGGQYQALNPGCACIDASSGGINAQPVPVSVNTPLGSCPACPTFTPTATPTSTPHSPTRAASTASIGTTSTTGTVLWTFDAGSPVAGPIIAAPDGGAAFITADSMLYSVDAKGNQRFDRPAGGLAPAIAPDGTIFARGTTSWIYALDRRGVPIWKLDVGSGNGPLAADANTVYASANDSLVALRDGNTMWNLPIGNPTRGAIIDGGVVVASNGGEVNAFSTTGSTMWSFTPNGGFSGDITSLNGVLYVGSRSGGIYALDARDGKALWQAPSTGAVTSGPATGDGSAIVFGSDALYAVDSNGAMQWSSKAMAPSAYGLAAISGSIFDAAATDGVASMLDATGTVQWSARDLGKVVQVSPGASGSVLVGSSDGHVRALR